MPSATANGQRRIVPAGHTVSKWPSVVDEVLADPESAPVSAKLRALLRIASAVRDDGRKVTPALVAAARAEGATDVEIHDTVLIAAAFCMFNRYVDGLGTLAPADPRRYAESAKRIVEFGYAMPRPANLTRLVQPDPAVLPGGPADKELIKSGQSRPASASPSVPAEPAHGGCRWEENSASVLEISTSEV